MALPCLTVSESTNESRPRPVIGFKASPEDEALLAKLQAKFPTLGVTQIIRLAFLALAAKEGIEA